MSLAKYLLQTHRRFAFHDLFFRTRKIFGCSLQCGHVFHGQTKIFFWFTVPCWLERGFLFSGDFQSLAKEVYNRSTYQMKETGHSLIVWLVLNFITSWKTRLRYFDPSNNARFCSLLRRPLQEVDCFWFLILNHCAPFSDKFPFLTAFVWCVVPLLRIRNQKQSTSGRSLRKRLTYHNNDI